MVLAMASCNSTLKATPARASVRRQRTAVTAKAVRASSREESSRPQWNWQDLGRAAAGTAAAVAVALSAASPASAGGEKIAEFTASGLIFKDSVEVLAIPDPDVDGVTIFISDFKRSLADKLAKDFFSEPSQASVTCAATGPIVIKNDRTVKAAGGQEVFTEQKGLNLFQAKTTRVRRIYDAQHDTLLYISYSTRLSTAADEGGVSTGRYRTSICALPVSAGNTALTAPAVVADGADQ